MLHCQRMHNMGRLPTRRSSVFQHLVAVGSDVRSIVGLQLHEWNEQEAFF